MGNVAVYLKQDDHPKMGYINVMLCISDSSWTCYQLFDKNQTQKL